MSELPLQTDKVESIIARAGQKQPNTWSRLGRAAVSVGLLPPGLTYQAVKWAGGKTFARFMDRGQQQEKNLRALDPGREMRLLSESVDKAIRDADFGLVEMCNDSIIRLPERVRVTLMHSVVQDAGYRHLRDASRPRHSFPEMNEDRILEFKNIMEEHRRPGDTLANLYIDEAVIPTLESLYPHYWPAQESLAPELPQLTLPFESD